MNGRYEILDGLRGVTAIMVVSLHFLDPIGLQGSHIPHVRLVLDFVFCLSGFVLTCAYGDALGTRLSFGNFYATRWIRISPMLLCGLFFGIAALLAKLWLQDEAGAPTPLGAAPANLFLWPSSLFPIDSAPSSPGNGSPWWLLLQFVVSLAFPWLLRAGDRILIVVMGMSGIVVMTYALTQQSLVGHHTWTDMPIELIRTVYPVTVGIFLYRLVSRMPRRAPEPMSKCVGLAVLLMVIFVAPVPMALSGLYEAVAGLFLLPMLMLYAASTTPAAALKPVMLWLGAVSYPLYAIHDPFVRAISGAMRRLDVMPGWQAGAIAAAALGTCLVMAWIALKKIDEPVRRWLTRRYIDAETGAGHDEPFTQNDPREVLSPHGVAVHEAPGRTLFKVGTRTRHRTRR